MEHLTTISVLALFFLFGFSVGRQSKKPEVNVRLDKHSMLAICEYTLKYNEEMKEEIK